MEERYSRFIRFGNGNNVNNEVIGEGNDGSKPKSINEVFSANDGIVTPKLGPKKSSARPIIVVIDDDYATLDLLKIYLQRDYECATFSNPKEAIFYLNSNIPDAIYIDCYMTITSISISSFFLLTFLASSFFLFLSLFCN